MEYFRTEIGCVMFGSYLACILQNIIPFHRLDFLVARKEPVGSVCVTVFEWGSHLEIYKLWQSQISGWKLSERFIYPQTK